MTQYRVRRTSYQFSTAWSVERAGEMVALFRGAKAWTMAQTYRRWLQEQEEEQHAKETSPIGDTCH